MDEENPWGTLNMKLPGGLIPAIADETVIKWGMGKKTGDTISYMNSMGETMNLLLVGGLAPSIFQGKVIISNQNFLENFPSNSGTSIFLVEGNNEESDKILNEINSGFRDYGMEVNLSATRLAEFNSVTNTYLSIFLVLGAFGLLLGTIGLGIVLFRSILERKNEIAVMSAVGFSKKLIRKIVIREYYFLLISGIGIGFITAIIATLPSILSPNTDFSIMTLLIIFEGLLFSGWIWIWIMTTQALKNKLIYSALRND
jgi:ABC-type antimicrobial peptide transport system permease subunit